MNLRRMATMKNIVHIFRSLIRHEFDARKKSCTDRNILAIGKGRLPNSMLFATFPVVVALEKLISAQSGRILPLIAMVLRYWDFIRLIGKLLLNISSLIYKTYKCLRLMNWSDDMANEFIRHDK